MRRAWRFTTIPIEEDMPWNQGKVGDNTDLRRKAVTGAVLPLTGTLSVPQLAHNRLG